MFSKDEIDKSQLSKVISLPKNKAVGDENTSSIYSPMNTYTDASSVNSRQYEMFSRYGIKNNLYKNEGDIMDENKLLEKYMDKIDRDQRDLREEMKEREERIEKRIAEADLREKERMDRIERLIHEQDEKMEVLKEIVSDKLEDDKKYRHSNNIAIALGVIATVISMIGIYYATVSMVTDIIGVAVK